ncbi:MAG TPA: hypothetical protein VJ950_03545 [Acidimicrobiia bacterium]|nr:hypothetical protein [Acidimicrobiia bacterium]
MSLEKQLADYGRLQEELFGAIEVHEITNPLTEGRQERTPSSQTLFPQRITWRTRYAGPAWAVAAFVSVLAVGAVYLLFSKLGDQVADNPPPTTVAPDVERMTDLEVIEAGVAALYSGNADRAVELFELPSPDDDNWIREWAAYQAAIEGRLSLNCIEQDTPGVFTCRTPYHNAMTDAVGYVDDGDTNRVVVEDGVITQFNFPEHTELLTYVAAFLRDEGSPGCASEFFDLFPEEGAGPPTADCASFMLEYLDEWAAWATTNLELPVTDIGNPTRLPEFGQGPIGPLDPGAYIADADGDPATTAAATFLIESSEWMGSNEGVFRQNSNEVLLHVHQVDGPYAAAPLCDPTGDNQMPASSTAADLAERFAVGGFTVRQAPAPVRSFGYDGYHVVIEVPEGCDDAQGWQRGIFLHPGDVMEAWIFDMGGDILMVEAMWRTASPEEELAELKAVVDTLVLSS